MNAYRTKLMLLALTVALTAPVFAAALISTPVETMRVYPNPWRSDRHAHFMVTFDGLPAQAPVRVFTLSGHQVRALTSDSNGKIFWDRTNDSGDLVASGVYLYSVSDSQGQTSIGKLAIIR